MRIHLTFGLHFVEYGQCGLCLSCDTVVAMVHYGKEWQICVSVLDAPSQLMKSRNSVKDIWKWTQFKVFKHTHMWNSKQGATVITNVLLQLGINKAGFLKSIKLEVWAIHLVPFISILLVIDRQKQLKPRSCTHFQVINKIHRKE